MIRTSPGGFFWGASGCCCTSKWRPGEVACPALVMEIWRDGCRHIFVGFWWQPIDKISRNSAAMVIFSLVDSTEKPTWNWQVPDDLEHLLLPFGNQRWQWTIPRNRYVRLITNDRMTCHDMSIFIKEFYGCLIAMFDRDLQGSGESWAPGHPVPSIGVSLQESPVSDVFTIMSRGRSQHPNGKIPPKKTRTIPLFF